MFISKIIEIYTLEIKQSMYTYKGLISYLWALSHIIRMYYDQSHVISSLLLKSKFRSGLLISSGSVFLCSVLQPSVCYPHRWGVWNYTEFENNLLSKKRKDEGSVLLSPIYCLCSWRSRRKGGCIESRGL